MERSEILDRIRDVARLAEGGRLTQERFQQATGIPYSRILSHFDSWSAACNEAGVSCGPTGRTNLKINPRISEEECLEEIKRIAALLEMPSVSIADFNKHGRFASDTVMRRFGGWNEALDAAGLGRSHGFRETIPLADLADDFLKATIQVGQIPTLRQTVRRSGFGLNSFSRKFGGWDAFKRQAIGILLARPGGIPAEIRELLEQARPKEDDLDEETPKVQPLAAGQTLNFRGFAYAPTYEQDVVALFGSVFKELGFEVLLNRPAFPDCIARRRTKSRRQRFKDCRIEFELRSRDFVAHKHPPTGCDLIVCWEDNWPESPVEVLELRTEIRRLKGWT